MVYSMTGFARAEVQQDWGELVWEVRSVNHRYLECYFRIPEELRMLEIRCRELIASKISRGKLDCQLRFKRVLSGQQNLQLNEDLARQVVHLCREIDTQLNTTSQINAMQVLRWPDVVKEPELSMDSVSKATIDLLELVLDKLMSMRAGEGERMTEMLLQRCDGIEEIVGAVRENRPQVIEAIREKLNFRLQELTEKPDLDRLEQELVFQAQKLDVDEELDRLQSHVKEIRDVLKRKEPIGRRLDFLMQELNREANTLGSKSSHVETTRASVELKVMIEQMREQVQNIE